MEAVPDPAAVLERVTARAGGAAGPAGATALGQRRRRREPPPGAGGAGRADPRGRAGPVRGGEAPPALRPPAAGDRCAGHRSVGSDLGRRGSVRFRKRSRGTPTWDRTYRSCTAGRASALRRARARDPRRPMEEPDAVHRVGRHGAGRSPHHRGRMGAAAGRGPRSVAEVGDESSGDLTGEDPAASWDRFAPASIAAVSEPAAMERTVRLDEAGKIPGKRVRDRGLRRSPDPRVGFGQGDRWRRRRATRSRSSSSSSR